MTAVSETGAEKLQPASPDATIAYGASDAVLRQAVTYAVRSFGNGGRMLAMSNGSSLPKRLHLRGSFGTCSSGSTPVNSAPAVTDTGLALLSGQTVLEELDLRESAITDASLPSLTKLANLKRLDLRGTRVTEQACGRLAKALPGGEIVR